MTRTFLTILTIAWAGTCYGQKPVIDTNAYKHWESLSGYGISDNGAFGWYQVIDRPLGSQTIVCLSTDKRWQQSFAHGSHAAFTEDSKFFVFCLSGDTLALLRLGTREIRYIPHVHTNYPFFRLSGKYLVYQEKSPANEVVVYDMASSGKTNFPQANDFVMDDSGNALLVQSKIPNSSQVALEYLTLKNGKRHTVWQGNSCSDYAFSKDGRGLVFMGDRDGQGPKLWYYRDGDNESKALATNIKAGCSLVKAAPVFSGDGEKLFFTIQNDSVAALKVTRAPGVNIWNFKDKILQGRQTSGFFGFSPNIHVAVNIKTGQVSYLNELNEAISQIDNKSLGKYVLLNTCQFEDYYYNKNDRSSLYLVSVADGSRKLLAGHLNGYYGYLSPDESYALWFDRDSMAWYSYDIVSRTRHDLSEGVPETLYDQQAFSIGRRLNWGLTGWSEDGRHVFLYDRWDIWRCDLAGVEAPVNITRGKGKKLDITFSPFDDHGDMVFKPGETILDKSSSLVLSAFNNHTKDNGFWRASADGSSDPESCLMDGHSYYIGRTGLMDNAEYGSAGPPVKAKDKPVYLIARMNANESQNLFITSDLKHLEALSEIHPESKYNWLITELVNWRMTDGNYSQGVLYKPENFDSTKKYPVIFFYYVKKSDQLHSYLTPAFSAGVIDIPTYVSDGYLVFCPDIWYRPGQQGEAVLNSVLSAADYLSKLPYVDSTKLGLMGHSFGAWETNYLVTHSTRFAAAVSACGVSDEVSAFGMIVTNYGMSNNNFYELLREGTPYGVGVTPWSNPDIYIRNSPVFNLDKVSTPVLILSNEKDGAVPLYPQGMEMFTGLKRAGKKVWMLQYDNGGHGVFGADAADFTIRMKQFFDHYLKGAPAPKWMVEGIPAVMKGKDNGYELMPGREP